MSSSNINPRQTDLVAEARNLFEFLIQAQSVRETPTYHLADYEDVIWLADFPEHTAVSTSHRDTNPQPEDTLFEISRIAHRDAPPVPHDLKPWLKGKVSEHNSQLSVASTITAERASQYVPRTEASGLGNEIYLEDHPEVANLANEYLSQWRDWAAQEIQDSPARKLYDQLFQISQEVAAHGESVELVLGVGALAWKPTGHNAILRHLLTFPIQMTFDDKTGVLSAICAAEANPVRVELDMLSPALVSQHVNAMREEVKNYEGHPLHRGNLGSELARFANGLDAHGSYCEAETAPETSHEPRIAFAPALILRRRSQRGLIEMFETISRQMKDSGEVPAGLLPMIDPNYRPAVREDLSPGGIVQIGNNREELFLPMPVNERQLQVIQQVNTKSQVVVQGPPGTGKTHTAAALLSHLLAQGKRVLVTAHTDRALHEVRGKLPDAIRPLSVAVVGNSQADMSDLRVAVETINNHADEYDAGRAKRAISTYLTNIERLRGERAETFTRLRQSREAETTHHVVGPYSGTIAAIVLQLQSEESEFLWIESVASVKPGSSSPLDTTEAQRWHELLTDHELNTDLEESLGRYPELDSVLSPMDFSLIVDGEAQAMELSAEHEFVRFHENFADIQALDLKIRQSLKERTSSLVKRLRDVESRSTGWVSVALADIRSGRGRKWRARFEQIDDLVAKAAPLVTAVGALSTVEFPPDKLALMVELASAVMQHLEQGGEIKKNLDGTPKIGMFTNKIIKQSQPFFDNVLVDERPATDIKSVRKFLEYASGARLLDAAKRQWPENVEIPEGESLHEQLEWHRAELGQLARVLELGDVLHEAEEWIGSQSIPVPNWGDIANVQSYSQLVEAVENDELLNERRTPLEALAALLEKYQRWENVSPVVGSLIEAVNDRKTTAYDVAYKRLVQLHVIRERYVERSKLQERVDANSKSLVEAVLLDPINPVWATRLGSMTAAWEWAAARSWVRAVEATDVNKLQNRLAVIEDLLRNEIESLAAERAWSHAVNESRMGGAARAHLRQYAQLVKRLGKGTGKYAPKQREEIRKALDHCRPSVPVWIMPLYRIADQFKIKPNMFDVVLVDEASQAGLEASFLQYMAPKIVVIGDDKQVSPSAVGVDQQQLRDLANQYLPHNPFKASWQDPKRSYFDEATMRFGDKITLIEHRRCVPEIIGFSNKIAYEPENIRLLPVRQRLAGSLPPVKAVHVTNGFETGKTNVPEAKAIVEQIISCLDDPAYAGKTMGVVSLTGKEQAKLITGLLLERITPEIWQQRDLRCGDAADFQGSERDVIFLSMVKTANGERRVGALTAEMYVQRYNVAASRAKDQMWLFHSLMLSDLGNPDDMRYALLDYVTNAQKRHENIDSRILADPVSEVERVAPFDSLFEQRVFNRIYSRGYSVIPQYPAEGYKIDLVVIGANGNLAIECDGDAWHGPEHFEADMARQRDLERCGWRFFRVRESKFYMDKEASLSELWPILSDLNRIEESRILETATGYQKEIVDKSTLDITALDPVAKTRENEVEEGAEESDSFHIDSVLTTSLVAPEEVREKPMTIVDESILALNLGTSQLFDSDAKNQAQGHVDVKSKVHDTSKNIYAQPEFGARAGYIFGEINIEDEPEDVQSTKGSVAVNTSDSGGDAIVPYRNFEGSTIPALSASKKQIIESLIEILEVEGPMVGTRLQAVYAKSSGQRLGRLIVGELESALRKAVRDGLILESRPLGEKFVKARTFSLPDRPKCRKRMAGDRGIEEIPIIELAAILNDQLVLTGMEIPDRDIYRKVLMGIGLTNLTPKAEGRLDLTREFLRRNNQIC